MDHIYADANEKWVKNTMVYVMDDDPHCYIDEDCTVMVTAEQLDNLFHKGLMVVNTFFGGHYFPYFGKYYTSENTYYEISIMAGDVSYSYYSSEYIPEVDGGK